MALGTRTFRPADTEAAAMAAFTQHAPPAQEAPPTPATPAPAVAEAPLAETAQAKPDAVAAGLTDAARHDVTARLLNMVVLSLTGAAPLDPAQARGLVVQLIGDSAARAKAAPAASASLTTDTASSVPAATAAPVPAAATGGIKLG